MCAGIKRNVVCSKPLSFAKTKTGKDETENGTTLISPFNLRIMPRLQYTPIDC